jgi:hypothetical protein
MRTPLINAFLSVILTCCALALEATAGSEPCEICTRIAQTTIPDNAQAVVQNLPCIDSLWPSNPEAYFQCARQAVKTLSGASLQPGVEKPLLDLFDHSLEKSCPTNNQQAISCFHSKSEIALWGFGTQAVRTNKLCLVAVAKFVGEVRSRRIPNYDNQSTKDPGWRILSQAGVSDASSLTNPVVKEAYQRAVQDNQQNLIMDELQLTLFSADRGVTPALLYYCSSIPRTDPQRADFIREVAASAHLTDDEQQKL